MNTNLLLPEIINLAKIAGEKIIEIYQTSENCKVYTKSDETPLTEADLAANKIITEHLKILTPDLPILSEESNHIEFAERKSWHSYWLIDPLDGTKEFIERTGEFSINIALIKDHKPILGVVYAPMLSTCYFADEQGAFKQVNNQAAKSIQTRAAHTDQMIVIASRRHGLKQLQHFLDKLENYSIRNAGSALKLCLVAEGEADIYPRFGPTSEWDTAAGQCVLERAGGMLIDDHGKPLCYNTKDSLINPTFFAVGDKSFAWQELLEL